MPTNLGARARGSATSFGFLAAWRAVRMAPEPVSLRAFELVADRIYAGDGPGVRRLRSNLARAGVIEEAVIRQAMRSYLRYWCESFRLPSWPVEDLVARTRTIDGQILHEAVAGRRGTVVALPHMGNWDWAGAWARDQVQQVMSVAERLKPERVFDEFIAYRESIGIHVIPLTGAENPMPALSSWLREGGLVCLLADRDLGRSGVGVELLGEPARVPAGPAVLARRTGAPLVPATLWYDGPELVIRMHEPVPPGHPATMMQGVADAFTESIRAHPVDWHMLQRVFEADLGRGT
ncbi:MAG: phosphatidylinositol mannoside acyltransferase [Actinomycetota bacterium]|nr:phosphatidylinositol mannoside acyltransferase [Actinomycetota bacterium]